MPRKNPAVVITPLFKVLIGINGGICLCSLLVMLVVACASGERMTAAQDRIFHVCEFAFTTTTGAFVGLMAGRAAGPEDTPIVEPIKSGAKMVRGIPVEPERPEQQTPKQQGEKG